MSEVTLDGHKAHVLEVRDRAPGSCPLCMQTGLTALLVGSAEKGGHRRWVMARRTESGGFRSHTCKAKEAQAA